MQNSRERLIDFAALCLWLSMSAAMAFYVFFEFGQDFRGYYAAARVLLEGRNPYDYAEVARILLDVTGRAGNNPFYYPLWFGWFLTPLSILPFQAARGAWMLFNVAIWLFGLVRLQQLLNYPRPGWRAWLLNLLATFIFAWTTWKFEQTGILLFVIMVEVLIAYQEQRWNRMGLFMALALIKPNVMLVPVVTLAAWLLRQKQWRPVIVTAVVLVLLILITTALTPGWQQPFFQPNFGRGLTEVLDGPDQVMGTRLNTTILDWLKWMGVAGVTRAALYTTVLILAVWILSSISWKSKSILEVASVSLLISYAITPYALQYDYPPLAIVLFWALANSAAVKPSLIPWLLMAFIASVLIWERPISDGYWIVIALGLLALWVFSQSRDRVHVRLNQDLVEKNGNERR